MYQHQDDEQLRAPIRDQTLEEDGKQREETSDASETDDDGKKVSDEQLLQARWEMLIAKDLEKMSAYEHIEAKQDLAGTNLLAAIAPRSLTEVGLQALNKELHRRLLHRQSPTDILQVAASRSPMFNDRDFRVMFARAERMNPTKAATRLLAYLSYATELFGQEAMVRPVPTTTFNAIDEQILRVGWIQLLLTRDRIGRRIIAMDDLGPGDAPLQNKMRVALFLLQAASRDDESQKKGIQLVLQIFDPANSSLLKSQPTLEQFRRLFACSPIRFSVVHVCVAEAPSTGSSAVEGNLPAASPLQIQKDRIIECTASLFGVDERIRTKFHAGSIIECHSRLSDYGINPDCIPMTSTGRVKLKDHEKWIMIQVGCDRALQRGQTFAIVECPSNMHILLVKGRHVAQHEGNKRLRRILQERYDERNDASRAQKIKITSEVLETLHDEGYTFLIKNSADFWIVPDRKTVLEKLAIAFRTVPRLKPFSRAQGS